MIGVNSVAFLFFLFVAVGLFCILFMIAVCCDVLLFMYGCALII